MSRVAGGVVVAGEDIEGGIVLALGAGAHVGLSGREIVLRRSNLGRLFALTPYGATRPLGRG